MKTKLFISKVRTLLGISVFLIIFGTFLALALNISTLPYDFLQRHLLPCGILIALYVILQYADDFLNRRFIKKQLMRPMC